jgi:hypothetical protein
MTEIQSGLTDGTGKQGAHDQFSEAVTVHPKPKAIVIRKDGTIAPEVFTDEELAFFKGWQPITVAIGKDFEESSRVGRAIDAIPKLCWRNARRVAQRLDDYQESSYIEGIACLNGCPPLEHSWVCRTDGTIIDPTLPRHDGVYFPGLEFRGRAGISHFLSTRRGRHCMSSPFFYAFGWGGNNSPGIRSAWHQGWAYLRELHPHAFCETDLGLS